MTAAETGIASVLCALAVTAFLISIAAISDRRRRAEEAQEQRDARAAPIQGSEQSPTRTSGTIGRLGPGGVIERRRWQRVELPYEIRRRINADNELVRRAAAKQQLEAELLAERDREAKGNL